MTNNEDFAEDSTMQELHQIREELERQQQESGLSILEWLEATEKDFRKSLAADGFRMVKRNGRIFMYEIKRHSKSNGKSKAHSKAQHRSFAPSPLSQHSKRTKHKAYDDYIEDSTMREMPLIREARAFPEIETQAKKKHVKYKTAAKRNKKNPRKK
jgi:hypothetical protein